MSTLLASYEDVSGMLTVDLWCENPSGYYVSINEVQPCERLEVAEWLLGSVVATLNPHRPLRKLDAEQLAERERALAEA